MNHPAKGSAVATSMAALVLMLGACGDASSDESTEGAPTSTGVDRRLVHDVLGGAHYRYEALDEPEDLADDAAVTLALVGEVAGYEAGPAPFADDPFVTTIFMKVRPTDVFDGAMSDDGLVWVMMTVSTNTKPSELEAALPVGAPTALYLNRAVDLPSDIKHPVWVPVSPQGFIVEDDKGSIFPLDPELDDDQTLDEQVPPDVDAP